jgi:hypothetical protein
MRRSPSLAAGILVLLTSGCGVAAARSPSQATNSNRGAGATEQPSAQSCSVSIMSNDSSREVSYCEYVLPDGRRFNCNMASLTTSTPTTSEIEGSKACVALPRLSTPSASHTVVKAIGKARACLRRVGMAVKGGPVPPEGHGPGGPEGELIVSDALIAFYIDPRTAKRAESEVRHNARSFHGEVERHDSVTIIWLQPPPKDLRSNVHECVFRPPRAAWRAPQRA